MRCEESQFDKIHDEFRSKIHHYLTRLVGEQTAEDLTQEVFLRVSQALPDFRGESQLSTWLYRIATNVATDKMRTASFRDKTQGSLDDLGETLVKDVRTGEEMLSLEQKLLWKERYECFRSFVDDLPIEYRTVFVLSELQELTNNEIAQILGTSLDVVKIRLHRARARLFQQLRAHCKPEDWL